jgi:hypothetical protein
MATDSALSIEHEEFLTTLAAFQDDLQPAGPIELPLVERLAQIDLRLQRAVRLETTHLEMKFAETIADAQKAGSSYATDATRHRDNFILTLAFLRDPAALKLISQYESRLARDFSRTLTQLRAAQELREQTQLHVTHEFAEQTQSDTRLETLSEQTQRSHPSDGVVAPSPSLSDSVAPESAKQTQPPHQAIETKRPPSTPAALTTNQSSILGGN